MAALFGDEITFRRDFARIDMGRASEMAALVFAYLRRANAGAGTLGLVAGVTRGLIVSQKTSVESIAGHCEVAERLAERLGLERRCAPQPRADLRAVGRARPAARSRRARRSRPRCASCRSRRTRSCCAPPSAPRPRRRSSRSAAAAPTIRASSTGFLARAGELTVGLDETTWDAVLALEPEPHAPMSDEEFDAACLAMADFADLKSPYSVGHSRAVAALAGEAARRCGLPAARCDRSRSRRPAARYRPGGSAGAHLAESRRVQ